MRGGGEVKSRSETAASCRAAEKREKTRLGHASARQARLGALGGLGLKAATCPCSLFDGRATGRA